MSGGSGTPTQLGTGPSKSPFLTSCRRMGLKRRSSIGTPLINKASSPEGAPCAKKATETHAKANATPKRPLPRRSRGLCVTRVEKPSDAHKNEVKPSENEDKRALDELEESVLKKKEFIELLKKGVHPLQIEKDRLTTLTSLWRNGCQQALQDLLETLHKNSEQASNLLTMKILISNLDIPYELINFDPDKEEFY
ncbi:Hypothetical predicted protein [Cloeon dipterum]|uniref:Swi5-dependent recombination DNA repair protein 1 homolog n=1 Tax=Cloeon dipterum TaxID=197152 RepID=A0A8S1CE51_9INSE|nr:Hypothetical predicted protein [Cloeon dipterum]